MDYESVIISRAILEGKTGEIIEAKVDDDLFTVHKNIWLFIRDVYVEHGAAPPVQMIEKEFPEFTLAPSEVPISLALTEMRKRHVHNALRDTLRKQARLMEGGDPFAALDLMRSAVVNLDAVDSPSRDVNLAKDPMNRLTVYNESALVEGMTGIPTPWEGLNRVIFGFHPEDLIMLAGRGGVGKTWGEIVIACYQWMQGYTPLVFSNEMSVKQIVRRVDATHAKLPYKRFRSGMLSGEDLQRWEKSLRDMKDGIPFWVSGDASSLGVSGIRAKIRRYKPHMVLIDGAYLMNDELKARAQWERWSNICHQLKQTAQTEQIPIAISHQFNLGGIGDGGTADTLKYGDVQMWFDLILGMYQTDDLRVNKEMLFKILKHREGEQFSWISGWDIDKMDFPEKIGKVEDPGAVPGAGIADPQVAY